MVNYPQQIINAVLDTVFPIRCLGCMAFTSKKNSYLCITCQKLLPLRTKFICIGCEQQSPNGKTCFMCRETTYVDQLLVLSDYSDQLVVKLIKTLKYRLIPDVAERFRPLIKKYLRQLSGRGVDLFSDHPLVIPIPLHYRRLNSRGFNQAELIAKILAEVALYNIGTNPLVRTSPSKPQAEIEKKEERLKNVADIFSLSDSTDVKNKTCILVDDVCTTGATLNEAAKVLKKNGASKIIAFVIAKG